MKTSTTITNIRERTTRRITITPATEKKPAVTTTALDVLLAEAADLLRAGDTASPVVDGYPTRTPGAANDGPGARPHDDDSELGTRCTDADFRQGRGTWGHARTNPTTATEAAMLARLHGATQPDPVGRLAQRQRDQLGLLVKVLDKIAATNAAYQRLRSPLRDVDTARPYCHVARLNGLPWDEKWETVHTTDFASVKGFDTLDEAVSVCQSVYDFVRTRKRFPTKDEMLGMLQRQTDRTLLKRGA